MSPRTLRRVGVAIGLLGLMSLGGCAYYPYGYGYYPGYGYGYGYGPGGYYPAYAAAAPVYGSVAIGFGGGWGGCCRGGWHGGGWGGWRR